MANLVSHNMTAAMAPHCRHYRYRFFMIGLGISTCLVINVMRRMLLTYRNAVTDLSVERQATKVNQEVEDSLQLCTLKTLLDNPSYTIRETSSRILCERALHDPAVVESLLQHITHPDYETREPGVRALRMIMNSNRAVREIATPKFYMAIMKSLEYSLTDYEHHEYDTAWDNWNMRDVAERGCLSILEQCVREQGPDYLVRARFVGRWLAKEPWGEVPEDDSVRQSNFNNLIYKQQHYRLYTICTALFWHNAGRKQLFDTQLVPAQRVEDWQDVRMINGLGTSGENADEAPGLIDTLEQVVSRRPREQSAAEEHLRRRHREVMVINGNIIPG
ncbi:hypothetical protein BJ878DRAFT_68803 [Calycina marina]|uniref:ARM repeat superfamily protein n=1 Tax=Calycina marina TaxID=1763456 RepID=A0A9P7Z363_9HELO|nr:hypothetical protein BJ878DRAFT_68803 [Calycina marina]